MIKFLKKGLKDSAGKYYPVFYSRGPLLDGREVVTVYARDILKGLPKELQPINDTDSQTDYFDTDRVHFAEGTAEFELLAGMLS